MTLTDKVRKTAFTLGIGGGFSIFTYYTLVSNGDYQTNIENAMYGYAVGMASMLSLSVYGVIKQSNREKILEEQVASTCLYDNSSGYDGFLSEEYRYNKIGDLEEISNQSENIKLRNVKPSISWFAKTFRKHLPEEFDWKKFNKEFENYCRAGK